jgi:hypothetical protein
MHAQLPSADRDVAAAFVALEGDGAEVPAGFAGFGAVVDEGFRDRGVQTAFFTLLLATSSLARSTVAPPARSMRSSSEMLGNG